MPAKHTGKPDPKFAFLSGEAFLEICKVLIAAIKSGNTRILTLAIATNAAFSLEMYLKCLLLLEHGQAPRVHDIYDLFHALSSSTQSELTKDHEKFVNSNPLFLEQACQTGSTTDLEELLKLGRNAFTDFRYAHEQIPSGTVWGLNGLTFCVCQRILKLRPDWKTALQEAAEGQSNSSAGSA
jgi:hypothetical protein